MVYGIHKSESDRHMIIANGNAQSGIDYHIILFLYNENLRKYSNFIANLEFCEKIMMNE